MPARLLIATLLLALSPTLAHACTCTIGGGNGLPWGPQSNARPIPPGPLGHWEGRDAIFVGQVLEIDPPEVGMRPRVVKFVTEAPWRGALPDTVTVMVDGAPCAYYVAGERYIVSADVDTLDPRRFESRRCAGSYPIPSRGYAHFADLLGAPTWTAPPLGQRALDAAVVRLGTPRPREPTPTSVVFIPPTTERVGGFEVADYRSDSLPTARRPALHLEPGIYHIRITWKDGTVREAYMSVRCELRHTDGTCQVIRSFFPPS